MEYKNYPLRLLMDLFDALKNEATNQGRSINRQLETILKERYNAHAPPKAPINTRSVPKPQNDRKSKAAIS